MDSTQRVQRALKWSALGTGLAAMVLAARRATASVRATADEAVRSLPGDDLIADPLGSFTNAVTIDARREVIWSWLAQMGAGRAGWYSYDRLDNGGQPSATVIRSELQPLSVGMVFPASPGISDGFTLVGFETDRSLVLDWKSPEGVRMVSWAFVLEPFEVDKTRLIVRARGAQGYQFLGLPKWATKLAVSVIHFIMQRKQLLGIAARAQSRATALD